MSPTLPVAEVAAKVPSTKAWLLLLSLLSTLLIVSHKSRPVPQAPTELAGQQSAPRQVALARAAAQPTAQAAFAPVTAL